MLQLVPHQPRPQLADNNPPDNNVPDNRKRLCHYALAGVIATLGCIIGLKAHELYTADFGCPQLYEDFKNRDLQAVRQEATSFVTTTAGRSDQNALTTTGEKINIETAADIDNVFDKCSEAKDLREKGEAAIRQVIPCTQRRIDYVNTLRRPDRPPFVAKQVVRSPLASQDGSLAAEGNYPTLRGSTAAINKIPQISTQEAHQTIDHLFHTEFFKRVPEQNRAAILKALQQVDAATPLQQQSLNTKDFSNDPFFQSKHWLLIAVKEFLAHRLNTHDLSLFFLYDQCHHLPEFQVHTQAKAVDMIVKAYGALLRAHRPLELKKELIRKQIEQLKPQDQQFFSYTINRGSFSHREFDILQMIADLVPNEDLTPLPPKECKGCIHIAGPLTDKRRLLILPPQLFYAVMQGLFGAQAIEPNPVLGYRPCENLSNPLTRVMSIDHMWAPARVVHGFTGSQHSNLMYLHDCYHLTKDSSNPYRSQFIEAARRIKKLNHTEYSAISHTELYKSHTTLIPEILHTIRVDLLDRDIRYIHSHPPVEMLIKDRIYDTMHTLGSLFRTIKDSDGRSFADALYAYITTPKLQ